MSDVQCPARLLICADPAAPDVAALIAAEHVASVIELVSGEPGSDEPVSGEHALEEVAARLDELVDLHRGECVVLVVPAAMLASLGSMAGDWADRHIRVIG